MDPAPALLARVVALEPGHNGAMAEAGHVLELTDLLRQLIQNRCENDGSGETAHEGRNAETLWSYLEGSGLDMQTFAKQPGRENLVARLDGTDHDAPTLLLLAHTDVVPADPDRWTRDPFGGELVDNVVWGRGAVDMLNMAASMAVAMKVLSRRGFRPRGHLVFAATADEEAGGDYGCGWLVDHHPDAVRADYVITETGGAPLRLSSDGMARLPVAVGEKGVFRAELAVKGAPGHTSMPFRTENALRTAASVLQRLCDFRPPARLDELWTRFVNGLALPDQLSPLLSDPTLLEELCSSLPDLGLARFVHACTHTSMAPTTIRIEGSPNAIPHEVTLGVDIRSLPGDDEAVVRSILADALGDLASGVDVTFRRRSEGTTSSIDSPLWTVLQEQAARLLPGTRNVPFLLPGATDARFFRHLGATCYGFALFSDRVSFSEFARMFHGDDERIDLESLALTLDLWVGTAKALLG